MKIKLTIEYDGANFYGWQKQNGFVSVQETVERAINRVFGSVTNVELHGAGRTDTGVHALGQVAHFEVFSKKSIEIWQKNTEAMANAINFYLMNLGVVIVKSELATTDFHARFSAKMRHYRYVIYNR